MPPMSLRENNFHELPFAPFAKFVALEKGAPQYIVAHHPNIYEGCYQVYSTKFSDVTINTLVANS